MNIATTSSRAPIEIPTLSTVSFVKSHVPSGGTILEVGCGSGHVARNLASLGYQVVAVDSDEEAVSQARQQGVEVVQASWPDVSFDKVNGVVFTRSLHHMPRLPEAVSKARDTLETNGKVLVEDFAFDEAEAAAIEWFVEVVKSREAQALMSPRAGDFISRLLNSDDPVQAWHQDHDHDLHSASAMKSAVVDAFGACETQRVPYLYRYLVDALVETHEAASFVEEVFSAESHLGSVESFTLIGYRIIVPHLR